MAQTLQAPSLENGEQKGAPVPKPGKVVALPVSRKEKEEETATLSLFFS